MPRTARATALLTAILFTLSTLQGLPEAFAQSQTDVNVLDLDQLQSSQDSTQTLDIGNASGGGSSKVTIDSVTQTQSGQGNTQQLNIGNAKGGNTNVHLGTVKQTQSGSGGTQKMNVGNVGEVDEVGADSKNNGSLGQVQDVSNPLQNSLQESWRTPVSPPSVETVNTETQQLGSALAPSVLNAEASKPEESGGNKSWRDEWDWIWKVPVLFTIGGPTTAIMYVFWPEYTWNSFMCTWGWNSNCTGLGEIGNIVVGFIPYVGVATDVVTLIYNITHFDEVGLGGTLLGAVGFIPGADILKPITKNVNFKGIGEFFGFKKKDTGTGGSNKPPESGKDNVNDKGKDKNNDIDTDKGKDNKNKNKNKEPDPDNAGNSGNSGDSNSGGEKSSGAGDERQPKGEYANVDAASGPQKRGLRRQNESADLLAREGYDIEMLPDVPGGNGYGVKKTSNPDYLVGDKVFDCYSPETANPNKVAKEVANKTREQAPNIVLNLDDYPGNVDELLGVINRKASPAGDLKRLEQLITIKDGKILDVLTFN